MGVLFDNFELTEPFELGESGTYSSPVKGNFYVRCKDEWTKLADNKGQIALKLQAQPKSKQAAE